MRRKREGTFLKRNRRTATILALGLLGANLFVLSGTAQAAKPRCMDKKATQVGTAGADTITGTKGNDVIVAKGGDDIVFGKGGKDIICGGGGSDIIFGQGGSDKLNGGALTDYLFGQGGNDDLIGGPDADTAGFTSATGGVNVDLGAGRATGEGTDDLTNINGVFGSDHDDTIVGDDNTNFVFANAGNDNVQALGGIDLITPGAGDDTVDGGSTTGPDNFNLDIVYFTDATVGVTADLQAQTATGEGNDTITNFESVYGSDHDDTIVGDAASNILFGGLGDDDMDGGGGNAVDYAGYWFAAGPINASLQTNSATGEGNDTLSNFEGLLGTIDFDDTLTGDNNANYLDGDLGNDTLDGLGGDDLFLGGGGDDTMIGGQGDFDMADYFCVCDLNANLGTGIITGDGTDSVSGIEGVGAADGDDTLIGDAEANIFFGWGGNDVIQGMGGDDQLDGGAHTNDLDGGPGTDACARSTTNLNCESFPASIPDHPLRSSTELVANLRRNF
jgi:Ca2+-binding RTX toxin-like protein